MADDKNPEPNNGPLARTYDFFKHLTSLSLVSLGGVLGLPAIGQAALPQGAFIAVVLLIGNAGALALMGSTMIANSELKGRDPGKLTRGLKLMQEIACATLLSGIGLFLGLATRHF